MYSLHEYVMDIVASEENMMAEQIKELLSGKGVMVDLEENGDSLIAVIHPSEMSQKTEIMEFEADPDYAEEIADEIRLAAIEAA